MLAYYGTQISPNQMETAEGFLICRNVPIARTGRMEYLAHELQLDGDPERIVSVERYPEDVFEPAALASFEGKPVTDGHPPESVGPENYASYLKGHIQEVRREGDYMVADLYINDAVLASEVQNGVKREVSCGYLCNYIRDGTGYRQSHIRGNHVAVVLRGRAGREVAIKDAADEAGKGRKKNMNDFWKSVLTAFGMAAKDASPEELETMVRTTGAALDAAPENKPEDKPEEKSEDTPEKDEKDKDRAEDSAGGSAAAVVGALSSKLDQVIELLSAQKSREAGDGAAAHDERAIDSLIRQMSGDAQDAEQTAAADTGAVSCAVSNDTAVELLRRIRPAVAAIKDKTERARVVDALLDTVKGPDVMGRMMQAAQDSARKAADVAKMSDYDKLCADQQAEYYARNPHKNREG